MAITMELGGVNLGSNFPLFARSFEPIRVSDQGPSFKKVNITLGGFVQGLNSEEVIEVCEIIAAVAQLNSTTFTYVHEGVTRYDDKKVYISGYSEPQDGEHARNRVGDYSISLYYFEDSLDDEEEFTCTYGTYTFDKVPKWGRRITPNRESHLGELDGSTANITLSGTIYRDNHADLMAAIAEFESAFSTDEILTYGVFAQSVRVMDRDIQEDVKSQYAFFSLQLAYNIGQIISLRRKISISRVHNNTVITEQPFCNTRLIEHMNVSGQFITYRLSLQAEDLITARNLLATEAAAFIEPGGIEMQGGVEDWDYDNVRVDLSVIKFYNTPILANIP